MKPHQEKAPEYCCELERLIRCNPPAKVSVDGPVLTLDSLPPELRCDDGRLKWKRTPHGWKHSG